SASSVTSSSWSNDFEREHDAAHALAAGRDRPAIRPRARCGGRRADRGPGAMGGVARADPSRWIVARAEGAAALSRAARAAATERTDRAVADPALAALPCRRHRARMERAWPCPRTRSG